jgi:hypothetical protein
MTTYTRAQVATEALKDAGLVGEDETPSSAAQESAEAVTEACIGELRARGIILLDSNESSVQHELLYPLVDYIAARLEKQHGLIDRATMMQNQAAAEARLRQITMIMPTYAVQEAEYY